MKTQKSVSKPTERSIAAYVKKNASRVKTTLRHRHTTVPSMREAEYKGHHISVRTTYDIRVDGMPVTGQVGVTNDGQVHYHPVPNLSFASAVDLVKQLIDVFPDDFGEQAPGDEGHGAHKITVRRPATRSTRRRTQTTRRRK